MEDLVIGILGYNGRLLSMSKSGYRNNHPDNLVIFNANVCVGTNNVWYGDLDVTLDKFKLLELSQELKETIYVLYEMDGRFENEREPQIKNYVVKLNLTAHTNLHQD